MHCMSPIIPLTSARNAIHRTIACILSHIVVHFTLLTLAFWRSLSPPLSPSLSFSLACCCQSVPLIAAFEMHRFALETYHYHHYICYSVIMTLQRGHMSHVPWSNYTLDPQEINTAWVIEGKRERKIKRATRLRLQLQVCNFHWARRSFRFPCNVSGFIVLLCLSINQDIWVLFKPG